MVLEFICLAIVAICSIVIRYIDIKIEYMKECKVDVVKKYKLLRAIETITEILVLLTIGVFLLSMLY